MTIYYVDAETRTDKWELVRDFHLETKSLAEAESAFLRWLAGEQIGKEMKMKKNNRKETEFSCGDRGTFDRAWAKGEQTFAIRSQDVTAARCIAFWILENINDAPEGKLRHALEDALRARRWPSKKWAD